MVSVPITISQRETVERLRQQYGHRYAAWNAFHSLFLWQNALGLSILAEEDFFAVRYGAKGENCWYMPCGSPARILSFLEELRQTGSFRLFYARKEDIDFLKESFPHPMTFRFDRDGSEYLYDVAEQCAMPGRKFSLIRHGISKLHRRYAVTVRPLTPERIGDAEQIMRDWANRKGLDFEKQEGDIPESMLLLHNQEALHTDGVLVYLDGVPTAIAAGAFLSEETADMSLYKVSRKEPGLSFLLFHEWNMRVQGRCRLMNAEEDLGIMGLRDHKQRLRPAGLSEMWEAVYEPAD